MNRFINALKEGLMATVTLWSLWLVSGGLQSADIPGSNFIPLGLLFFSALYPRFGLAVFIVFVLPFGGDYPGTSGTSFFLRSLGGLTAGLWARHLFGMRHSSIPRPSMSLRHPVVLAIVAFGVTALGSLMAVPVDEWGVRFIQLGSQKATAITGVKETWVLYVLLKCMVIMTALVLMTLLAEGMRRGSLPSAKYLLLCFMGSYILVIGLGLGDYFGLISLSGLRGIATGVKPDDTPLRLQSLFGHPAWCAMYVSALAPAVVVLFDFRLRAWIRNTLIISLLVLGEYLLILTFARGGWISYPFTLVAIWGCVYASGPTGSGRDRRVQSGDWRKIILSLPTTILLSVGLMLFSEQGDYGRYLERLKAVSHSTDRTAYINPALKLAQEHPVMGGGVGSFAFRYVNDFVLPSGPYFSPGGGPLSRTFNNAHSLWLGLMVGQGFLGVLAMLAILMAIIWTVKGVIIRVNLGKTSQEAGGIEPLAWIAFLCSAVSLGVYGIFDDTFYPASNVLVFFLMAGLSLGASTQSRLLEPGIVRIGVVILLMGFLAQGIWEFVTPGKGLHLTLEPGADGCYRKPEERSEGHFGVWCSEKAQLEVPVSNMGGQSYASLELVLPPNEGREREVSVGMTQESENFPKVRIKPALHGKPFWIVIPMAAGSDASGRAKIEIHVSEYLVPLRNPTLQSLDRRRLAFAIPLDPTAFSENAGSNARCIALPSEEAEWRDFWCAGGGKIPVPIKQGQPLDVSVRLIPPADGQIPETYLAFAAHNTQASSMVPLADGNRKLIIRGFDSTSAAGLRISSSRPAVELGPMSGLGFVVGFRNAQD